MPRCFWPPTWEHRESATRFSTLRTSRGSSLTLRWRRHSRAGSTSRWSWAAMAPSCARRARSARRVFRFWVSISGGWAFWRMRAMTASLPSSLRRSRGRRRASGAATCASTWCARGSATPGNRATARAPRSLRVSGWKAGLTTSRAVRCPQKTARARIRFSL